MVSRAVGCSSHAVGVPDTGADSIAVAAEPESEPPSNGGGGRDQTVAIRRASPTDIGALVRVEAACFATDRVAARSFSRLVAAASADVMVRTVADAVIGYALVLYRDGTGVARLYSFAVAPAHRRRGHARALLAAAVDAAVKRRCRCLRLEVRVDNVESQALYAASGFRQIGRYRDYYEDHADALRFEKPLGPPPSAAATALLDAAAVHRCSTGLSAGGGRAAPWTA